MGFEDIKNGAKDALGNAANGEGGLNGAVDGLQEQHGDKLGGLNEKVDGLQEQHGDKLNKAGDFLKDKLGNNE
ncbi:hypothetical protein [Falsarthrobacter nasiphocae]|uniref:Uncharacterized protein n=1 Tax=Falsarthrobacter nasiphocae TaxID=189863 RepID=A0AAE4C818_9MICC|nr:hypothetical protein [Falsarthrobacter nasiphocae]MDR6891955.1 hypothetical protein [Falsarthrobacter nasiphocae]